MDIPIDKLRTMPAEAVLKIQAAGIETIEQFYNIACHQKSRAELAQKTGISDASLEAWASEAGNMILIAGLKRT